jgi:alpha-galactosidase/6-phospho-beta-glucosidase family protein
MKITIIGGGAHRVLGILRGALARPGVLDDGTIHIHDLDTTRAEVMGRMLLQTPELRRARCRIAWTGPLAEALAGADVVGIIMPAGSQRAYAQGHEPSLRHGFISSDNISPSGAMAAVRIAPVVLNIARQMEIHCPDAWLVNFVNPTAVLSGMVNNHTRIRAFGVCQGFTNHLWDIPRLFGRDEEASSLQVESAGINHLAYVVKGRWESRGLLEALAERLADPSWQPPVLQPWWNEAARQNITRNVGRLARVWRELGVLIFSTEPDGMDHLMYDEAVAEARVAQPSAAAVDAAFSAEAAQRAEADRTFHALAHQDLDDTFWAEQWKTDYRFKREDEDIFVRIFAARAGVQETRIATSRPNQGAIIGIKDRHVVEYTQTLGKEGPRHDGPYEVPDVVHGLTAGFAAHQTLLGDALAHQDPHQLAHALLAYPMRPYSGALRSLYKELFAINDPFIAEPLRTTTAHL